MGPCRPLPGGRASGARAASPSRGTHPVCTGLATGLMLSEVSVAGLLGIRESSSYSLDTWGQGGGKASCYHPRSRVIQPVVLASGPHAEAREAQPATKSPVKEVLPRTH